MCAEKEEEVKREGRKGGGRRTEASPCACVYVRERTHAWARERQERGCDRGRKEEKQETKKRMRVCGDKEKADLQNNNKKENQPR